MKEFWKKHKYKLIIGVAAVVVLAFAFWYGGGAPGLQGWTVEPKAAVSPPSQETTGNTDIAGTPEAPTTTSDATASPEPSVPATPDETPADVTETPPEETETPPEETETPPEESPEPSGPPGADLGRPMTADEKVALAKELAGGQSSEGVYKGDEDYSASQGMEINEATGKDKYLTDPVPEGKPIPVEPQDAVISDKALTCRLSVRCDSILDNMSWLDKEKWELVPADGVIYAEQTITFYEGESVFNVLQREMKRAKIHMEFMNTPMYNSAYIEGINNLYEFDVGELSGWMYKVNGWFPNYGASRYQLKDGDLVEWVYTCNLGVDVGGYYAVGG